VLSNRYFRLGLAATLIFLAGVCAGAGLLYYRHKLAISAAQIKRHNLSGEVFLQTTDGSVRRAAGATVYVVSDASQGRSLFTSLLAQVLALQLKKGISDRERVESLRATILQLSNAHVWYSTTCDSSGEFRINLPIGKYYLVATGRAGRHEAVWLDPVGLWDTDEKVSLADPAVVYFDFPTNTQ
jgi:hypothetical protein